MKTRSSRKLIESASRERGPADRNGRVRAKTRAASRVTENKGTGIPTEELLGDENLRRIEAEPGFRQMMEDSIRAEREGHVYTYQEVKAALRKGSLNELMEKRRREWRQRG
jgi:hypothetical protein